MIILRCDAANMATTLLCKIPNVNPKMPALWSDIAIKGKSTDYIVINNDIPIHPNWCCPA